MSWVTRLDQWATRTIEHNKVPTDRLLREMGGLVCLVGLAALVYQAMHVDIEKMLFARDFTQAPLAVTCKRVAGCQKAELRMVYVREQKAWQKQLAVSGKNVAPTEVAAELAKTLEQEVRSPVTRWLLGNAEPVSL